MTADLQSAPFAARDTNALLILYTSIHFDASLGKKEPAEVGSKLCRFISVSAGEVVGG